MTYTFKELKTDAKDALSLNRGAYIVIVFIVALLAGVSTIFGTISSSADISTTVALVVSVISLAYSLIVIMPSNVGAIRGFRKVKETNEGGLSEMFSVYTDHLGQTILTLFTTGLLVTLLCFCFVIPGIIFGLKWAMVPYIISENPSISGSEARRISSQLMEGDKINYILLNFSFIGWMFLSALTCGILGLVHVVPYMQLTMMNFYEKMKEMKSE